MLLEKRIQCEILLRKYEYIDINIVWKNKGVKEIGVNRATNQIIVKVNPKFYRPSEVDFY